jgi:hypothetical protein
MVRTNLKSLTAVVVLALSSSFFTGCKKEVITNGTPLAGKTVTLSSEQNRMVRGMVNRMPVIRIYDENDNRFIDIDFEKRNFSFSEPNDGWNFSSSDDVVWESADGGGGILFIGAGAFGSNTGGTIVAGNTSLNVNYTFCFAASDQALGLDLFDTGADIDGISGVIGIAGDFDALLNDEVDEDADFTDYFQGFAAYFVYDNEASGSYDILNWMDELESDLSDLDGKGFGFVFNFADFALYFSYDGTLNVSGGSIGFNGQYLALEDLGEFMLDWDEEDEPEVSIVNGFGVMGC